LRLLHANVSAWPIEHPARSAPDTKSGPPSGLGARSAIHPTALLGFSPFAGLLPMPGANLFPNSRACMPFADRSPRFIFVAEPSVQRGNQKRKRTGDHESSVRLPGFNSRHRSALSRISRRSSRSCLGLCLFQVCGHPKMHLHRHDPVPNISLCRPFPAPIRSWVCRNCRDVPARERCASLRGPGHPCVSSPGVTSDDGSGPYSVFKGLMPCRSEVRRRAVRRISNLFEVSHRP